MNFYFYQNFKKYIKTAILIKFFFLLLISCSSIDPKYTWYTPQEIVENFEQLQPGDILILSKGSTLRSMWGHSAVLNRNKKVIEFPSYSAGYSESPLYTWLNLKRKIAVFRLKDITEEFKDALFNEIDKTITKPYGLTFDKNFDKRLYCSQFIYIIFKNAGSNVGIEADLDSDGGSWVMPFDIMNSSLLKNIVFNNTE